jgi:ribosomal protein S18
MFDFFFEDFMFNNFNFYLFLFLVFFKIIFLIIFVYDFFDYKDVYSLRRFMTFQGKILPKRLNKVTSKQQRLISKSV